MGFPMLRSPLFLAALVAAIGVPVGAHADPAPTAFSLELPDDEPEAIYGGTDVAACGWPTTVSMLGSCTGTLVHPQVVVYAAHCGAGYSAVTFGESANSPAQRVSVDFCRTRPGGGAGGGVDHAFCVLAQPVTDIPVVPVLMGCETDVLVPGKDVTIVGYGNSDTGPYGIKREVVTQINMITSDNEASIGGGGKDSCQGDSGGPVYVKLTGAEGYDDTWRVFGITSYGGQCGSGGMYSMMHIGMEWIQGELDPLGIDITPCHDADGTWNPGPDCLAFPKDPSTAGGSWSTWCDPGPVGAVSASCGDPFGVDDMDPPTVVITAPADRTRLDSDPGTGFAAVTITIDAMDSGVGVQNVDVVINGSVAGADPSAPYELSADFPPGIYEIGATATDFVGNSADAEIVTIGVDMDPPEPEPETTGGDGSGTGTGGLDDGGTADGGTADGGGTSGVGGDGGGDKDSGCGCSSTTRTPAWALGLFVLAATRRRRV